MHAQPGQGASGEEQARVLQLPDSGIEFPDLVLQQGMMLFQRINFGLESVQMLFPQIG